MRYPVVLEREEDGRYAVWVPDLPGCASMGDTRDEALTNIREAMAAHLEALRTEGHPIPSGHSEVEVIEIEAA